MARAARIVLVDSDEPLTASVAGYLGALGYLVRATRSCGECDALLDREPADLVVLDLDLPGESGLDYLVRLRDLRATPVLIFTAVADPVERVVGLELGADDFVVKPCDPQELAARIAGLLRRRGAAREVVRFERATVDLTASRLLRPGAPPERLAAGEVMLVRAFAQRPGALLDRETLLDLAPAESHDTNDRAIDTRIARLRRKLDTEAIVTIRGRGYMFVPPHGAGG